MNDIARFPQGNTRLAAPISGSASTPVHEATELTGPSGLAFIRLGEAVYTLRITRAGKLILTK